MDNRPENSASEFQLIIMVKLTDGRPLTFKTPLYTINTKSGWGPDLLAAIIGKKLRTWVTDLMK